VPQQKSLIGESLGGRYRIDELLGQGGMSAVYKGYDPNLKRIVHQDHSAHLANDPKFIVRFEEEAAAVAKLRHPNIVQVYDFNQDDGLYYMVLEFVAGETLQERLRHLNHSGRRGSGGVNPLRHSDMQGQRLRPQKRLYSPRHQACQYYPGFSNRAILMDFGIVKIVGGEDIPQPGSCRYSNVHVARNDSRNRPTHGPICTRWVLCSRDGQWSAPFGRIRR
jgi:hypothetical protein